MRTRSNDGRYIKTVAEQRFWAKVNKNGPIPNYRPELGPCWIWNASNWLGYGIFWTGSARIRAHRYSYELLVGKIPKGLTIDHLCRVHSCVNPKHLEPVTDKVNILRSDGITALNSRKTSCPRGHSYNFKTDTKGRKYRYCRTCTMDWFRCKRARAKESANEHS